MMILCWAPFPFGDRSRTGTHTGTITLTSPQLHEFILLLRVHVMSHDVPGVPRCRAGLCILRANSDDWEKCCIAACPFLISLVQRSQTGCNSYVPIHV